MNNNTTYWYQSYVIHCPDRTCKGMLQENDENNYLKCSDCEKMYIRSVTYMEIRK